MLVSIVAAAAFFAEFSFMNFGAGAFSLVADGKARGISLGMAGLIAAEPSVVGLLEMSLSGESLSAMDFSVAGCLTTGLSETGFSVEDFSVVGESEALARAVVASATFAFLEIESVAADTLSLRLAFFFAFASFCGAEVSAEIAIFVLGCATSEFAVAMVVGLVAALAASSSAFCLAARFSRRPEGAPGVSVFEGVWVGSIGRERKQRESWNGAAAARASRCKWTMTSVGQHNRGVEGSAKTRPTHVKKTADLQTHRSADPQNRRTADNISCTQSSENAVIIRTEEGLRRRHVGGFREHLSTQGQHRAKETRRCIGHQAYCNYYRCAGVCCLS